MQGCQHLARAGDHLEGISLAFLVMALKQVAQGI
jgi:hypothetical protein